MTDVREIAERDRTMRQLRSVVSEELISPIDAELATVLARRATASLRSLDEIQLVGVATALVSRERGEGHSCLSLEHVAGEYPWPEVAPDIALPDVGRCRDVLLRSGLCGDGSVPTPLVLDHNRLYLYRYYAAECRLATAIRARLKPREDDSREPRPSVVQLFQRLFPTPSSGGTDWQAVAAAAALRNSLTVITGGPGTGKTTTVAKILALLLQRDPALRIALAAPTGKAAARLTESIGVQVEGMQLDDAVRAALPREGRTLHRLLDYRPWSDRLGYGADQLLAEDVIVVDEASMVDLLMMDALFAAVRPGAAVILLGDQDQLASVEAGYVLGDICRAAAACGETHGQALGAWYTALSGCNIASAADASPLRDSVVRLRRNYRFENRPGIGALVDAVRDGDADRALATLDGGEYEDVARLDTTITVRELLAPIDRLIDDYLDARTPEDALERLGGFRVLCALRRGPTGVTGLNNAIERLLRDRGRITRATWYDRRPVLITANDPATGLFNGDIGVTFAGDDGRTQVWFPAAEQAIRGFAPARLPAHETAWAMTVHKSQGSEFGYVVLVLPDEENRVVTRELLYTGVTRAKEKLEMVANEAVVRRAVGTQVTRVSGLSSMLSGSPVLPS